MSHLKKKRKLRKKDVKSLLIKTKVWWLQETRRRTYSWPGHLSAPTWPPISSVGRTRRSGLSSHSMNVVKLVAVVWHTEGYDCNTGRVVWYWYFWSFWMGQVMPDLQPSASGIGNGIGTPATMPWTTALLWLLPTSAVKNEKSYKEEHLDYSIAYDT